MKKNQTMQMEINNTIRIPCTSELDFYENWLTALKPFHSLSAGEIRVCAAFLKERHKLSKAISDENMVNKILFGKEIKQEIMQELGCSIFIIDNVIRRLREKGVLDHNQFNKKLFPNIKGEKEPFKLLFLFDFK